jgi:16S rRNA (uracil1498-N3)-methyltransferase
MAQLQRLVVSPQQFSGSLTSQSVMLTPEQQHYLQRVLRLNTGTQVIIMDGSGQSWLAELQAQSASLLEPISLQTELPITLHLWVAPPKGAGLEEVIRQATELGVTIVQPVISTRTVLNPSTNKLDRWRRIAQEAAEQSERQIVPTIQDPIGLQDCFQTGAIAQNCLAYICVTRRADAPHLLSHFQQQLEQRSSLPSQLTLLTGPEGGWTDTEVAAAISTGFQPVTLGSRILRSVTAPLAALSIVASLAELSR